MSDPASTTPPPQFGAPATAGRYAPPPTRAGDMRALLLLARNALTMLVAGIEEYLSIAPEKSALVARRAK